MNQICILISVVWMSMVLICSPCSALTVSLSWDANIESTLAGYKVYYKADSSTLPFDGTGAVEGNSPVDAHNQTTATVSGLDSNRTYYFAVTAYDTSGLESSYSNIVTILEAVPPKVAITAPSNTATVSGTVSVSASASDNVGVTKVEFYVNGIVQATDTAAPYVYSWNTLSVTSGSYTLMTKAYDAAGNVGQSNIVTVTVVKDTTAPAVSLTAPGSNSTVSGTVAVTASASDNVGVSRVEFYINGSLLSAGNVSPYTFNWNTASVANGSYTLMAKAYDNAGNTTQSANVTVAVNNYTTSPSDSTAPVVSAFTLPATAVSLTVAVSSFTASDSVGVSGYLITESGTKPASTATGWIATAPTSFTFSSTGTKTAYAWAKDAAGNVSASRSATVTITLPATTTYTISDALLALQIGAGQVTPTAGQVTRLDVAPVVNGVSVPNGVVNTGDAIVLLSKVAGKTAL